MNRDDQHIAIAEATGYRWYWNRWSSDGQGNWQLNLAYPPQEGIAFPATKGLMAETRAATPEEIREAKHTKTFIWRALPFLDDLNAIAVAEATLVGDEAKWRAYARALYAVVGYNGDAMIRATAAQRAEAFLRAIGKWEEA